MELAPDLPLFLCDFGVTATVGVLPVKGIFENEFADPLGIVADTRPVFLAASSDLAAAGVAVGMTVTVAAVNYTIAEIQPDGTGMTRLMLKT